MSIIRITEGEFITNIERSWDVYTDEFEAYAGQFSTSLPSWELILKLLIRMKPKNAPILEMGGGLPTKMERKGLPVQTLGKKYFLM